MKDKHKYSDHKKKQKNIGFAHKITPFFALLRTFCIYQIAVSREVTGNKVQEKKDEIQQNPQAGLMDLHSQHLKSLDHHDTCSLNSNS